ncbi:helix-turn-helix domain-containing protein [Streptomyces microflavus]|uniref:helix-turn-helix domain-containing protein n=1 Tax=Streptomyces microflavus TaxID=1919 RepID=UPI00367C09F7
MFEPNEIDASSDPWRYLGSRIRAARAAQDMSMQVLATAVHVSKGFVSQIEHAARHPEESLVNAMDTVLKADGELNTAYRLAVRWTEDNEAGGNKYADYFDAVLELEVEAVRIDWFGGGLFPGLLQTPEYATEISRRPFRSTSEVQSLVDGRMERASILDGGAGPKLLVILDEAALRRTVGGPEVMAGQLLHTARLIREGRIVVQVLPFEAGAHPLLAGQLIIMRFADAPPVAYVEAPHAGQLIQDQSTLDDCTLSYDLARAAALSPEASLERIESAAKEYST